MTRAPSPPRSSAIKENVAYCSVCCNITETGVDPCDICADPRREANRICVVEEPLDVLAIERTGEFRGRYHVLHGAISPIDGIGPERLRVRELIARVERGGIAEVILATNPNLEGEATAMYLADLLAPHVTEVTRIARGLPVGGDLEYADDVTLIRSLQGRRARRTLRPRRLTLRASWPTMRLRAGSQPADAPRTAADGRAA